MSMATLISGIKDQCFVEGVRFISVALLIWKITRNLLRLGLMTRERYSITKLKLALDYFSLVHIRLFRSYQWFLKKYICN